MASSQKSVVSHQNLGDSGLRSPVSGVFFRDRLWLLLSGFWAGLAFLSKSPSLFLMPFIALTGLWFFWKGGRWKAEGEKKPSFILHPSSFILLVADGLLWFAVAAAVVFAFWPAMWVAPLETVQTVIFIGSKYATGGHAKGNFFLGEISQDPGALFYPATWLYRTSPLVLVGVVSALLAWPLQWRKSKAAEQPISQPAPPSSQKLSKDNLPTFQPFDFAQDKPSNPSAFRLPPFRLHPLPPPHPPFIFGFYLLMTIGEKNKTATF
ncbi:MAG: hypothetical protein HC875_41135, partial [Anaerolineales bacterium]|nr:hypothetical protein [Anaerolineales bacterium]